jgi:glycosyltransferase involved in cell wall biosynthesis
MKNIVFNGRFLTRPVTGVERFALESLRALDGLLARGAIDTHGSGVSILSPIVGDAPSFSHIPVRVLRRFSGHLWEQLVLPFATRSDFLVNLCNTVPILPSTQLLVLHDAAVVATPQNYSLKFRTWYQVMIRSYLQRAKALYTVSEFSASEISKWFGYPASQIHVIPESGEHILRIDADKSILQRLVLAEGDFVLAVSSMAPNKNFGLVLKAMELLDRDVKVVIVGGKNSAVFVGSAAATDKAVWAGYVSDAELRALYESAGCFAYPSRYEGFGLPPLEAMSCGCPTIVSRAASMPEVCGEAALYCDVDDPASLAAQINSIMHSNSLRQELSQAGRERASQWTWQRGASRLWEAVQEGVRQ